MAVNFPARLAARRWLDRLLPQPCVLCGQDDRGPLCTGCRQDLPRIDPQRACPRCAQPRAIDARLACGACLRTPPPWQHAHVPYLYAWPLSHLVAAVKFGRRLALAAALGGLLADALPPLAADLVLPVPLHPRRLAQRGFNQANELAAALARRQRLQLAADCLRRVRSAPPQSDLPAAARRANVRGAFAADARVAGQDVLLVDDVVTTGSTARAATQACLEAGARNVVLVALARA